MRSSLKEVIAFIRPDKWQATREVVDALGAEEAIHWRVMGRGQQSGLRYVRPQAGGEERGMQFLPKWMASWFVEEQLVESVVDAIIQANCTNNYGDGKIFVCPLNEVATAQDPAAQDQETNSQVHA